MIKGCKEKFFINQIFDENIRRSSSGKKVFRQKNAEKKIFFAEKLFSLMKTSDIFIENLVNKKLLLAAFYHLTYQHDSKDFNICNYNDCSSFCLQPLRMYGIKTEPGENSTVLLLFGSNKGEHEWVVFKV